MATTEATGRGLRPGRVVHADLVNLEAYAIYKAITELFGERGWEVIWRSGEIVFDELQKELNLTETEPLALMQRLADWLVETGYIHRIDVSQPSGDELVYEMEGAVLRPAVLKLREAKAVLPHWSTVVMAAALKKVCGIEVEVDAARPEILSPTRSREMWKLRRS